MNLMQHDFQSGLVAERDYGPVLGTPFGVFISEGVSERKEPASGEIITDFVDLPGLIAVMVQSRVMHPRKLSGDDLKYIRSALCLKSKDVAQMVEMSAEHYSRCENGAKAMSAEKEKFYRMVVFLKSFEKRRDLHDRLSREALLVEARKIDSKKAEKAMTAFSRIFLDMKLSTVYPVGERLAFHFYRGTHSDDNSCGDNDQDWARKD